MQNVRGTSDPQTDNSYTVATDGFRKFVAAKLLSCADGNDRILSRTCISYLKTTPQTGNTSRNADDDLRDIRNWLALVVGKGNSRLTVRRYLGKLHALYLDYLGETEEKEKAEAAFGEMRKKIETLQMPAVRPDAATLKILRQLPEKLGKIPAEHQSAARALLYALYCGGTSFAKLLDMDRLTPPQYAVIQAVNLLKETPVAARRRYLFTHLHGRQRTPRAVGDLAKQLGELLRYLGAPVNGGVTPGDIRRWWVSYALEAGAAPDEIAGMWGQIPEEISWIGLAEARQLSEGEKEEILQTTADHIYSGEPNWYALYLRDRRTPDDIEHLLKDRQHSQLRQQLTFFYPTYGKARRSHGKIRHTTRPYLPRILFLRTRPDTIREAAHAVGEYAWCFKTTNTADAPYAVISRTEMATFRKMIGVADGAVHVDMVRNPELGASRHVRITGGQFRGYEGTIYKTIKEGEPDELRTFVLRINDTNQIVWQVRIPEEFLEPIES